MTRRESRGIIINPAYIINIQFSPSQAPHSCRHQETPIFSLFRLRPKAQIQRALLSLSSRTHWQSQGLLQRISELFLSLKPKSKPSQNRQRYLLQDSCSVFGSDCLYSKTLILYFNQYCFLCFLITTIFFKI